MTSLTSPGMSARCVPAATRTAPLRLPAAAWTAALCLVLAACSGAAGASQHGHAHPASPSAVPSAGPAAAAAVKSTWQTVFNGAVPIPKRLPLLQDPPAFIPFIRTQEKTSIGALVLQASATVSSVTLQPGGRASVVYTILLGGKPLEKDLTGTAVYSGGGWKVTTATFCGLLELAYGKKSSKLPAVCRG